jgi:hypothetical protein
MNAYTEGCASFNFRIFKIRMSSKRELIKVDSTSINTINQHLSNLKKSQNK